MYMHSLTDTLASTGKQSTLQMRELTTFGGVGDLQLHVPFVWYCR